ncbi:DUF1801 domain-containing protein [Gymnodinialimonas sp. 57CJ19]|uniref:DUF1801 domain-containing protein n=1 Tax=Gymnodinialimonas sp. 57CJ19 TaxID=3138498 RepID=UPI0031346498
MDELTQVAEAVKALARDIAPRLEYTPKYGGEVFVSNPAEPQSFVGGIFLYKNHLSIEFSDGANFDDPQGLLEGKGKARRHLKLHNLAEITEKSVTGFLRQAFD